jgi:hypothetical protein
VSDALISIPGELIFTHNYLGIIVWNGKEISEFSVNCSLVIQSEGHLHVKLFVFAFTDKVDLFFSEGSYFYIVSQINQMIINDIFQELAPICRSVSDNCISNARVFKIELSSAFKYSASNQVIPACFMNNEGAC